MNASSILSIIAIVISLCVFIYQIFKDHSNSKKIDKQNIEIKSYNEQIKNLKKQQNIALDEGLTKIANSILNMQKNESSIEKKMNESEIAYFKLKNENENDAKELNNTAKIVREQLKRTSITNKKGSKMKKKK